MDTQPNQEPHLQTSEESLKNLLHQGCLISPYQRVPIRSDFPEHFVLVNNKNDIAENPDERKRVTASAKQGNVEDTNKLVHAISQNRCCDLWHAITSRGSQVKTVGIVYPDRPKDAPKNILCKVLAENLAARLGELAPNVTFVLIPVYQIQRHGRTVKDDDPRFENRSRFLMKKPENKDDLPEDYIILDDFCAKGDTIAEIYSLLADTVKNYKGKDTRVLGTAVMRTDYVDLVPDSTAWEEFNEKFSTEQRARLDSELAKMGLSVSALTFGQLQSLVHSRDHNPSDEKAVDRVVSNITGQQGTPAPEVPSPNLQEVQWIIANGKAVEKTPDKPNYAI